MAIKEYVQCEVVGHPGSSLIVETRVNKVLEPDDSMAVTLVFVQSGEFHVSRDSWETFCKEAKQLLEKAEAKHKELREAHEQEERRKGRLDH